MAIITKAYEKQIAQLEKDKRILKEECEAKDRLINSLRRELLHKTRTLISVVKKMGEAKEIYDESYRRIEW